jgi:hypothetical protein
MKKIIALLLCAALIFNCGIVMAAQAPSVQEDKTVKVFIDGASLKISNVAVIKDKKLMLSGELFSGLGISTKNQVWDKSKTKLTLTKDKTKLVMQINSTAATLNGVKKTATAKPFMYKSKAYFPVDFVAASFNKLVNKDSATNTYYIKDKTAYSKDKLFLDAVLKAMNSVSKLKITENVNLTLTGNGANVILDSPTTSLMDIKSKTSFATLKYKMSTNGVPAENLISVATFDGKSFVKVDDKDWIKQELSKAEFDEDFSFNSLLKYDNVILSALNKSNGTKKDESVLKGNVIMGSSLTSLLESQQMGDYTFSSKSIELTVNKNTNYISRIVLKATGTTIIEGLKFNFTVNYQTNFSDINGNFEVVLPDELKQ